MRTGCIVLLASIAATACASRAVREPPAPLVEFPPAYNVKQAWSADVGASSSKGHLRLTPRVSEGVVYAADPEGRVSALAVDSGRRIWDVDLHTAVSGAVGVGENLVLVGTRRGQVFALARDTGKQLWTATVSSEVLAPPAASGGVVAVQSVDGRIACLAAADGKRLWVYERSEPALSLRGTDTPIVTADAVVAGFASGKVVALRLQDGGVLWEATVSQPRGRNEIERLVDVDAAPLAMPDAVYAASYQGKLVALNPRSGAVLWSRDVSTYTGIATDGANLYLTDEKSHVLAFDRRTGASLWKQEGLRGRGLNAPVVYGDFVAVADYEGYVHWLARDDGHFVARHQIGGGPVRSPAAIDGETIFVASTSGTLAALKLVRK
jgi:outer membrane protein assembly factor BamB